MHPLRFRPSLRCALVAGAALAAAGCSSTARPPKETAAAPVPPRATLGVVAVPIPRAARQRLALPESLRGALVAEVLAGGPGALAGIRRDDVVERIGDVPIANACDFDAVADGGPPGPVRVGIRRAGKTLDVEVAAVDRRPFFEQACRAGSAEGCRLLAQVTEDRALEESACRSGSAAACAGAGIARVRSGDDSAGTIALLARACTLGSGAGCAHEAFLYAKGTGVARDDRRATALYVRGCDFGDALACYNAGVMADDGRGGPRSFRTAAARYEEACVSGSSAACTNLGFLYENGRGVAADRGRAAELYRRGCAGTRCQPANRTGCVNLGRAYRDGIGVEKDPSRAEEIFRDACDRPADPEDVDPEPNRARACSLLGALVLDRDPARGRELSELGCEGGDSFGCFNAAAIYASGTGVPEDSARAAAFLEKACRAGDGEGCFDLAVAYEKGNGVPADRERAAESFKRACALGFQKACGRKAR